MLHAGNNALHALHLCLLLRLRAGCWRGEEGALLQPPALLLHNAACTELSDLLCQLGNLLCHDHGWSLALGLVERSLAVRLCPRLDVGFEVATIVVLVGDVLAWAGQPFWSRLIRNSRDNAGIVGTGITQGTRANSRSAGQSKDRSVQARRPSSYSCSKVCVQRLEAQSLHMQRLGWATGRHRTLQAKRQTRHSNKLLHAVVACVDSLFQGSAPTAAHAATAQAQLANA
mmetsp:Transcript_57837/g.174891  ORF Transcript_57837/g.174891 Transcript_57837/m.174891 type:complete len:229 (-) Transcript_57837:214-900(-)